MKTKLQQKAERLLQIDQRRRAHNAALSMLHASPLKPGEDHETRGLKMWRKLRRLEASTHAATTAQCNGAAYRGQPFRDERKWLNFKLATKCAIDDIFGHLANGGYVRGIFINGDARGMALKLDPDKCTIPHGMVTDFGGYGILAAEINE